MFRYMTTKNPKTKKNEVVARNFEIIKDRYAIVPTLQGTYDEFYDVLMGSVPDKSPREFNCEGNVNIQAKPDMVQ